MKLSVVNCVLLINMFCTWKLRITDNEILKAHTVARSYSGVYSM